MNHHRYSLVVTLSLLVAAAPLAAQEIANGTFDTDLSGWNVPDCVEMDPENCDFLWVDLDHTGVLGSGSMRIRDFSDGGGVVDGEQCLPASAGQVWAMSAWVQMPPSDPLEYAVGRLAAYGDEGCNTTFLGLVNGNLVDADDAWHESKISGFVMPETTIALHVQILTSDDLATPPVTAYFDDVKVGIFFSGFESGLLPGDWSVVID